MSKQKVTLYDLAVPTGFLLITYGLMGVLFIGVPLLIAYAIWRIVKAKRANDANEKDNDK